ncbi:hypothetical protein BKA69DRAFT_1057559, partial [Paraphysoderma sedebokerense]
KLIWSDLARIMTMTAALILLNGGIHGALYSAPTHPRLARPLAFLYGRSSLPGVVGLIGGIGIFGIEKFNLNMPTIVKCLIYLTISAISYLQFSTVPGANFMVLSSLTYLISIIKDDPKEQSLPK